VSLSSKLDSLTPEQRTQLALRLSRAKRQAPARKEANLPAVQADPTNRFEPFPLTDLQQAYLIGRSEGIELGNISCHGYAEVDMEDWDRERFQAALQIVIDRHEMLRCIVLPEGQQQVLASPPKYEIKV
jgi:pyochelin synthetase